MLSKKDYRISEFQIEALKLIAKKNKMTSSEVLRFMISRFLIKDSNLIFDKKSAEDTHFRARNVLERMKITS